MRISAIDINIYISIVIISRYIIIKSKSSIASLLIIKLRNINNLAGLLRRSFCWLDGAGTQPVPEARAEQPAVGPKGS